MAWREGTNATLQSRFAAVRVRTSHRDEARDTPRPQEWLLIEWPEGDAQPLKYFLSSLPADTPLERLVHVTKMRWRIERDYRELKQEFGLGQYEGRNWRGLHHHATLCIAAYGFLLWQRLCQGAQKNQPNHKSLPYPKATGRAAAGRRQRHVPDSIATLRLLLAARIARTLRRCPCCGRRGSDL